MNININKYKNCQFYYVHGWFGTTSDKIEDLKNILLVAQNMYLMVEY